MAVDYLKTYLGIDPNDYSSMEARIRGEEPQARTPVMMRQPMMMPQQRSLGDIEAMQLIPRQQPAPQPAPQVDDRYQGLMDQIAALRSQIDALQAPTEQAPVGAEAPVMADTPTEVNMDDAREMFYQSPEFKEYQRQTEGMAHTMEYNPSNYTDPTTGNTVSFQDRSGLFQDWYKNTYGRDLAVEDNSLSGSLGDLNDRLRGTIENKTEPYQAPPEIENRAVGEPQPMPYIDPYKQGDNYVTDDAIYNPTGGRNVFEEAKAPAEDIQASIDYLAKLPKMNIPQIPDIEEIKRKMAEANMNFPEPVSYPDQLQAIRDLPPMNQMPTREEIQAAMQNMPTPTAPVSSMPKFNLPQMQSFGLPQQIAGGRTLMSDFSPRNVMRMASGGGIDQAIYDLKFKLNG
jgi:hypothetical protein